MKFWIAEAQDKHESDWMPWAQTAIAASVQKIMVC